MEHIYINANQISNNVLFKNQRYKNVKISSFNSKDNSKLRTYKLFKKELRAETYLNIPQFKFRKLIAIFRCSDHQLELKLADTKKPEVSLRVFDMCQSGKVENEIHFLIECEVYHDLRQTFLGTDLKRILTAAQKSMYSSQGGVPISK